MSGPIWLSSTVLGVNSRWCGMDTMTESGVITVFVFKPRPVSAHTWYTANSQVNEHVKNKVFRLCCKIVPPPQKKEKIPVCMCAVISFTVNTCYILSESAGDKESDWLRISHLVSWCFEPSQPQRIISGLKTNFSLSPSPSHSTSHITRLFLLAMDNASHQC